MEFQSPASSGPKPGMIFNIFVRVFGLAGLAALILPYYSGVASWDMAQAVWEGFNTAGINGIPDALFDGSSTTIQGQTVAWMLIGGPVIAVLFFLYMAITGKYEGGPFTFALCFLLLGWVAFTLFKSHLDLEMGFFAFVDLGFWATIGALSIPLLGMFFLDKSI